MAIFMMGYAVFILMMYFRSATTSKSKKIENQEKFVKSLNELEDQTSQRVAITTMTAISLFIIIFYSAFYLLAAIELDQTFFTIVSSLFVVLLVKDLIDLRYMMKNKKIDTQRTHSLYSYIGIFYTSYFIGELYRKYDLEQSGQMIIAGVVSVVIYLILYKINKKPKEKHL